MMKKNWLLGLAMIATLGLSVYGCGDDSDTKNNGNNNQIGDNNNQTGNNNNQIGDNNNQTGDNNQIGDNNNQIGDNNNQTGDNNNQTGENNDPDDESDEIIQQLKEIDFLRCPEYDSKCQSVLPSSICVYEKGEPVETSRFCSQLCSTNGETFKECYEDAYGYILSDVGVCTKVEDVLAFIMYEVECLYGCNSTNTWCGPKTNGNNDNNNDTSCTFAGNTISVGTYVCDNSKLMKCDQSGNLVLDQDCGTGVCNAQTKTCEVECTSGYTCNNNKLMYCLSGSMYLQEDCGSGKICNAEKRTCETNCQNSITFKESTIKDYAVEHWDTNNDGCISSAEAAAVTEIPNSAFAGVGISRCHLRTLEDFENHFPNLVTIGNRAFIMCTELEDVSLSRVKTIGSETFMSCENLRTVNLPSVTSLDYAVFNSCPNLTTVSIPKADTIPASAFSGDTSLSSLTATKATSIDNMPFGQCTNLKTLELPNVNKIGVGVFAGLGITDLKLTTSSNITLDSTAFLGFESQNCTLTLNNNKQSSVLVDIWEGKQWKEIKFTN